MVPDPGNKNHLEGSAWTCQAILVITRLKSHQATYPPSALRTLWGQFSAVLPVLRTVGCVQDLWPLPTRCQRQLPTPHPPASCDNETLPRHRQMSSRGQNHPGWKPRIRLKCLNAINTTSPLSVSLVYPPHTTGNILGQWFSALDGSQDRLGAVNHLMPGPRHQILIPLVWS